MLNSELLGGRVGRKGRGVEWGTRMGVKTHKHVDYICKIKADIINLDDCPAR